MKTFYSLGLTHKIFKDFEDVFIFEEPDVFCYFSEKFHYDDMWEVTCNTNTINVEDYINFLNTQTSRMFIDYEKDFFDTVDEVDTYYSQNIDSYKLSVYDFLKEMKENKDEFDTDFDLSYDGEDEHKVFFLNGSYKKFYSIESLQHFFEILKIQKIDKSLVKIKINPLKVTFEEYIETMFLFDEDITFPVEVVDLDTLNCFLNGLHEINEVGAYFDEIEDKKRADEMFKRLSRKEKKLIRKEMNNK